MNSNIKSNVLAGVAGLLVMLVAFFVFSATSEDTADPSTEDTAIDNAAVETTAVATTSGPTTTSVVRYSDLPAVLLTELPLEARDTLTLIDAGGPYPYRQDDGVFQNREGILPDQDRSHYREYTVDTPGSSDRGARRIVTGSGGERFYTDDHYDSFREILE